MSFKPAKPASPGLGGIVASAFENPVLPFRPATVRLALGTFTLNVLGLALPLVTMQVYDRILLGHSVGTLTVLTTAVIIAVGLEGMLRLMRGYVAHWTGSVIEHVVSCNALRSLLASDNTRAHDQSPATHVMQFSDIHKMREVLSAQNMLVMIDLPFVAIFLALIAYLSGWVVAVPLATLAIFTGVAYFTGGRIRRTLLMRHRHDERRLDFVLRILGGIHTVKSQGAENAIMRRFERLQEQSSRTGYILSRLSSDSGGLGGIFTQVMIIGTVAAGASQVISGTMTLGTLIACILLCGRIMQPIQRAFSVWIQHHDNVIARNHVNAIFTTPARTTAFFNDEDRQPAGRIMLKDVTYVPQAGRPPLFKNVSFTLNRGESVALTGGPAAVRSACLKMIGGLYPPTFGEVLVDGQPSVSYRDNDLVYHIGYLPPEGVMFSGTIRDNLSAFGRVGKAEVTEILELMELEDDLSRLPEGLDTMLEGQAGDPLPPGLRQRIAIARALATKPRVILYDQADRGLDRKAYNALYRLLGRLKPKTALVFVTDDKTMAALADRNILVAGERVFEPLKA